MAVEDDYRVGMIRSYLDDKYTNDSRNGNACAVCAIDLWQEALKEYGKPSRKDSNEISIIMQSFTDWEKSKNTYRFAKYGAQRAWFKSGQIKI